MTNGQEGPSRHVNQEGLNKRVQCLPKVIKVTLGEPRKGGSSTTPKGRLKIKSLILYFKIILILIGYGPCGTLIDNFSNEEFSRKHSIQISKEVANIGKTYF
jgi:hypothetical protein